jgi:uncharacterized protein (DUF488 family)
MSVYTVGHSTHTIGEFVGLLEEAGIRLVVDVRSFPRSRTNPQFNIELLPGSLSEARIDYRHLPELGGRRHRPGDAPPSRNTFWRIQAFRNYADYAATAAFRSGFATLQGLAGMQTCAIMCSEALWWRCHRRIISDYLLTAGFDVVHIMARHQLEPATLTANAKRLADQTLIYPA